MWTAFRPMKTVKTQKRRDYENELDHSDLGGCHRKVGYGPDFAIMRTIFLNMYVGSYPNAKFQAWINFVGI